MRSSLALEGVISGIQNAAAAARLYTDRMKAKMLATSSSTAVWDGCIMLAVDANPLPLGK